MASYYLQATGITNANDKNMLAISNATGSGKLIKIYRAWAINTATGAISGGVNGFLIGRGSNAGNAITSGTALNFLPTSSAVTAGSATPFTGCTAYSGATTITGTMATEFRRVFRATDELAAGGATFDEIQNLLPWAILWDTGYASADVEPLVLRENQSFLIRTDSAPGNSAAATFNISVELTIV
jgi:hypothetical protein